MSGKANCVSLNCGWMQFAGICTHLYTFVQLNCSKSVLKLLFSDLSKFVQADRGRGPICANMCDVCLTRAHLAQRSRSCSGNLRSAQICRVSPMSAGIKRGQAKRDKWSQFTDFRKFCRSSLRIHAQYDWTTGAPDNGNEWRKFPCRTSLVPLAFHHFVLCLIGVVTEGLLDYQGGRGIISIVRWNLRPDISGVRQNSQHLGGGADLRRTPQILGGNCRISQKPFCPMVLKTVVSKP